MSRTAHLHVASGYSARYGAALPEVLVQRAAVRGIGALALTDRDTVAGTVHFTKACTAAGIRPLFGAEVAVAPWGGSGPARRARKPVSGGALWWRRGAG